MSALSSVMTALAVGPHGGYEWGPGPWWPVFPIVWGLFWIAVVVTAVVLWRRSRRERPMRSALSVLAEEFARGGITEEEYERRLSVLRRLGG
ncbi:hypothetical protein GCM10025787_26470 [Saccharopolyspora rosea]|uniref:SHOCT domain-containing protein n=1 Tax=Saccharopolyspora rosea TaxID=524884 RepID=A0ABW3FNR8_9PSEU